MAIMFERTDMCYKIASASALAIRQPKHRVIKRDFLRVGNLSLVDPNQPMYQYMNWVYDASWTGKYKLELQQLSDTRYHLKRNFDELPEAMMAPWNPTVECLQYDENTTVWYDHGNIEFDTLTTEWTPEPVISEWEDVPEYQGWTQLRFPRKTVRVRKSTGFLAVYSLPPDGQYTLGQLKELGYAELTYETVTTAISLQTAPKPA